MLKGLMKKKIAIIVLMLCFTVPVFLFPITAKAFKVPTDPIFDLVGKTRETIKDEYDRISKRVNKIIKEATMDLAAVSYRRAMSYFLNKLAVDSAKAIASGKKGRQAFFETRNWNEYMGDILDEAAGTFIEEFGKGIGVDLCSPETSPPTKIILALVG